MSGLRETVRLRDKPARPHTATPPRHQGAVPVLSTDVHAEQHGETAHRARAQSRAESEGLPTVEPFDVGHGAAVTASSSSLSLSSPFPSRPSPSCCPPQRHGRRPVRRSRYARAALGYWKEEAGTRKQPGRRFARLLSWPTPVNATPVPRNIRAAVPSVNCD